ncbi:MAG: DUF2299 family protein [Saccharolobus sp.]|jgi:hypothetical protein|uniref:DUF2299 family protein n=1 Tax=Saccharolobus sp. TaxID=2100761 RepID=UPI0028CF8C0E|nr:DUF2299 family protein [Saccharolobus sp.]MDT7862157.1 DUF2299 family protein [Saccharolobus sp.]
MISDNDVIELFKELGMRVEKGKGSYYFHVEVSPPIGNGPAVSIIRPNPNSKYYIITMLLEVDKSKMDRSMIRQINMELAKMNVEVYMIPPEQPSTIQVAKIVFSDDLNKNELLNTVTLVKNASFLVYNLLHF